ncbi:T9SS sorting signal type C domain-containing protein [Flavobacterium sp. TR2]|uniref:T9SS sorting signal type C domain-containing protein n=1 Tax=Flavobacterium sp. TR2 TaxID=2977321 RepID=UPI0021B12BF9|nr:T9SS sorting signal type C domain-containing protein [Flavobacterium sp. TR2]UWY27431.1 T9SS sorting signal type C domain-containing protein [Flavobacterium sp. TR2]
MKKILLIMLLCTTFAFGQTVGDYRSVNSGDWQALITWEYYDGSQWVIPSGKAPQGYPGEFDGTHNVHIQFSKNIDISSAGITTKPFNQLLIDGALILNGSNANPSFAINASEIIVTKNLQPKAHIEFINQASLRLPQNSSLQVDKVGLTGNCVTDQALFIDSIKYAICDYINDDSPTGLNFLDLMNTGGSLTAIPTANPTVFVGETIFLNGEYTGAPGDDLSFQWSITDPLGDVATANIQNFLIPNALPGVYTLKFTAFTIYRGQFRDIDYKHSKTIEVTVSRGQSPDAPTAIAGTGATCSEITANWEASASATKYYLDVATDINFTNFVAGYDNLDVGNVLSKKVTGLTNGTTYYYRVYAQNDNVLSPRSNTINYATLTTPNGLSATVTAQPTCSVPTGTVTLNSSYLGDSRYEYNADGGAYQSSNVFTGLKPGNHVFTVRFLGQESCVSDPATATINESLQIPIADAGTDFTKTCNSNPSGKQIGAVPVDGVTYSWSPTLGLSDATVANPIANPTATTTYTLTATQIVGGCTATDTVVATVAITPPNAIAGNDFTKSCTSFANGNKIGSASELGISYSWTPSAGLSDSTISDPIANPDITTTYTLTAVNTATGCAVTDAVLVTVNTEKPIANAGIDFTKTCSANQNGKAIGEQAMPDTQYVWSPVTGLSAADIANPIANPSVTTVYTLEAINMTNGCKATDTVLVTVDLTAPIANAGTPFAKTCTQFSSGKEIGSQPEPETVYSWSPSEGLSSTTISNPIANPAATTTYTVKATNSRTGCIATDDVTVSVYSAIPIADAGTDFTKSCIANSSGRIIGTDALAGTVYSWSPLAGLSNANISSPIANPTETTLYTLTATNLESGCTATDQVIVTVDTAAPEANAGLDFTKSCTINPTGALIGAAPITGVLYNWSPSTGLSDPTISNPTANPNVSTIYTLTTTSTINGCTNSDTVLVTVDTDNPIADAGIDFTKTCTSNVSGKTIGVSPVVGNTYSWSPVAGLSSASISNPIANPTATTVYTLTVTGINGCSATDEIVVTVNNTSQSSGAAGIDKTINCNVLTASIGSIAEAETAYSWSPSTGLSDASISSPIASPTVTTTYTLTATNTVSGCETKDSVTVTVDNELPATPIPVIGYQPSCMIPSGKIILNGLPLGNWTVTVYRNNLRFLSIPGSGSSISMSNFSPATYYFTVTVTETGCISAATADVVITPQPPTPSVPAIGAITQPTCATGGSVVLNDLPATGTWTLRQSGTSDNQITGSGSSTTVSGLLPGTYQFKVVSDAGCVSATTADVVMNAISSGATLGTVIHPTCTVSTGSVTINNLPATGWTITQTGPINATITEPSPSPTTYIASALTAGVYNFVLDSGTICLAQDGNVTINAQPSTPLAPTATITSNPSCSDSETSILISNLPSGNWSLNVFDSTSSLIETITGTGTSYSIVGTFVPGNYTLGVTNEQGCNSEASTSFTIIAQPLPLATPAIGTITQPICGTPTGSVVINGLPASGTWTLNQSGTANASYSGSGTSFTVSSLAEGSYSFTVSGISGTCSSEASVTVAIEKAKIVPAAPTIVKVTQSTCNSNSGSIELSDLPSGSWTIYATPSIGDGTGLSGSGTTAILTGVLVGTYTITVKNDDDCLSASSLPVTLNPQPISPAIPLLSIPIQPTCTVATGSFTITNYDSSSIYVVSPNSGVTISGNTITAPRGNYTVTATLADCTSNASAVAVINKQPETPSAPVIVRVTQPTCESNISSIELSGLPVGSWTLFASPAIGNGTGLNGSGTTAILTGALAGTYTLTVKKSDGCSSSSSLPFTLNDQPTTPEVPVLSVPIQPSCTVATGSFTITNYNSNYTYAIHPNTGVTLSGNNVTAPKGNYTVTATLGNCTSGISAEVEILEQPMTPSPPIIGNIVHPNCDSNRGSVEVSGLPSGAWTLYASPEIVVGNPGQEGVGPTAFFSSMPPGSYTLTVKNSEGCISEKSILFTINSQPVTPDKPVLSSVAQPTCTVSTGNFSITNYDADNSYTVVPNTGVVISGNLITAPAGNYTVSATLGNCSSVPSEMVTINSQPIMPTPPIIDFVTQATCESNSGSVGLSGLPTGSWTLTSSGGRTLTGMGTTAILSGNTVPGTYTITVTNADGCISMPSSQVVLYAQPSVPNAPTVGSIIQPDCIVNTGTVVISIPAEGTGFEYNIDGGLYQASATFSNIPSGTHQFSCRSITVGSCISDPTLVEIKKPLFVNPPIIKNIIQPTCSTNGSILLEGLPAGSWTLYQSGTSTETILGSGSTATISNLKIGTYSYRVFDGSCLSKATPNVLLKPLESTAWTGAKWTNGLPSIDKYIYMKGNYTFSIDTEMCKCQAITGFIDVSEGITMALANELEVLDGATFSFANTSSLIQKNEVANIGKIIYSRFTTPVLQSDYVYWSSPVESQQLGIASPNTPSDKFFSFDANANNWKEEKPTEHMKISKGYSIGSPTGFNKENIYSYPIHFRGIPNNGTITTEGIEAGKSYLIGNPYPSAVNADQFLETNRTVLNGTLYFWSHNPQSATLPNASNDYASYNATGGVGIGPKDPVTHINNTIPKGFITAGQSFFIQGKEGVFGTNAKFDNTMRIGGNNSQFFKFNTTKKISDPVEKNRVWLNVYNNQGAFKQTLVGYITGATNEFDSTFDGVVFNGNKYIDFYSINQSKNFAIQGRALPFDVNDTVLLGFSTTIGGIFEISIEQTEGLLANQDIYLEDKEAFVFFNLKKSPYRFNTSKGTFDDRFVLHYKNETPSQEKLDHPVIVSIKDGIIKVNSFFEVIDKLEIYDILGRLIYKKENVNISEYYIMDFHSSDQQLIVKTFLMNKDIVSTKVIYTSYGY